MCNGIRNRSGNGNAYRCGNGIGNRSRNGNGYRSGNGIGNRSGNLIGNGIGNDWEWWKYVHNRGIDKQ